MYNGIGLPTPRGSGTNGYVQRNFALVRGRKEKVDYKTEDDIKRLDAAANKKPNQEILDHERKRKLELKCMELEDLMEEQGGYSKEEIERKVSEFRRMLLDKDDTTEKCIAKDEFGRPIVRETHQIAEANQDKNQRLREAFGISQYFVEGSSLDPNRREKEKAAAQAKQTTQNNEVKEPKSYPILRDSSSSPEPETSKKKKKKKQALNERERSESPDSKKNKKKKTKKHKRERSDLTSPPAKKKKKTREHKHKHKKSHSPLRRDKKKKKYQFSSDSDHNSSSDSDSDDSRLQKKDDNQVRKQSHISRTREKVNETSRLKSPNIRKRFDSSDQKQRNSNHSTLSASENVSPAYYENKNSTSSLAPISGKAKSYEVEKRRDSKSPEIVHKQQRKEKMKSVIEIQHSQEQVVSSSNASSESDPSSDSSPVSSRNCSPHELLNKRNIEEIEKSDSLLKSKSQTDEQESARKLNSVVHQEAYAAENKSSPIQKRTRDISPQQIRQSTTKNGCSSSPETSSLKKNDKSRVNNSCSRSRSHSDEDDDEERNIKRIPSLSPPRAYGGKANLRSRSQSLSHSRSRSPRSKSGSESRSRSRSRSQSWQRDRKRSHSSSRSLSFSPENRRRSRSRSRSVSRNRSRSNRSSTRSRSHSYSDSRSRSASTGRRSPSIPRRRGSPSFLDKRRITRRYADRRLPYNKFARRPSPRFQRNKASRSTYREHRHQPRQRRSSPPPPVRKAWLRSTSHH